MREHLEQQHGIQTKHVPLGAFDSSQENGRRILDFVVAQPKTTRFIVAAHRRQLTLPQTRDAAHPL